MSSLSSIALMQLHVDTLFAQDGSGQLRFVNEPVHPEDYPAPLVFVGRTHEGFVCRCRSDLPGELLDEVAQLAGQQAGLPLEADPVLAGKVRERLETAGWTIGRVSKGPAFSFPEVWPRCARCVVVNRANADLLRGHFWDIVPELDAVQPCVAAVVQGSAVANCRTVRRSAYVVEAGVNAAQAYRGRGCGTQVVAEWAYLVERAGLRPLYSTAWDNVASRRLAARLGLVQYGTDLSVFEATGPQ